MIDFPFWRVPGFAILWAGMFVVKIVLFFAGLFVVPFMYRLRDLDYRELPDWTKLFSNIEDWTGQPNCWGSSLPQWWIDEKVKKVYRNWYDRPFNVIKRAVDIFMNVIGKDEPYWTSPIFIFESRGYGFFSFYKYYAIRNSANGLRAIDPIRLSIDWSKVGYVSSLNLYDLIVESYGTYEPSVVRQRRLKWVGYLAWQGWKAGMKIVYLWNDERHLVIKLGWRVEPADVNQLPENKSYVFYETQKVLRNNRSFAMKVGLYRKG